MFTYLHSYMPETWKAQVDKGFITKESGIRFCQNKLLLEKNKFNTLAAKNGDLFNLIRDLQCPFYIDRLQGGCYIDEYKYDNLLLNSYTELLGENFWGFQMHEWMSNFKSDLDKLRDNKCDDWSENGIESTIKNAFHFKYTFLESMTANELAFFGKPLNFEEFYAISSKLYKKRVDEVQNLISCDSRFLAYRLEIASGTKRIMPEIGAQTCDTKLQIAYARGMANSYNVFFGTYYEPWGGYPFSACCYQKDKENEWGVGGKDFPFETMGENGGSSRSLQKRVHLYSYLSGAEFMSEEWGMCNTFYDWHDFEISPYGKVKLDFLNFVKKYSNVGKKIAPIAAVLPKELMVLDNIHSKNGDLCEFPTSGDFQKKLINMRSGLLKLFSSNIEMLGTETSSMINSDIPDVIDIIHEDNEQALEKYDYLIDLTGNCNFTKSHKNICSIDDVENVLQNILPCYVDGGFHWFINKCENSYYLTIFNNSGISRTVNDGEHQLPEAEKTAIITLKENFSLHPLEGVSKISKIDNRYYVDIPGGEWFFAKF